MRKLKQLLIDNKYFFIGYVLLLLFGSSLLFTYGKLTTFYLLNPYHRDWFNYIFYFFTILGDGFFCIPLGFSLLIIKQKKLCWLVLSSYIISGIIILILKNYIEEARPSLYIELKNYPYFIDHITLHNYHGFPSGHTASAFALASVLAFNSMSKRKSAIVLLITATLIGYSRVYLGQHFISDVMVGSVIGVLSGIFCWEYVLRIKFIKDSYRKAM